MNRISLKLLTVCGITCFMACTTTQKPKTEKWSERMARSEMKRFPEPWMIEKASKPRWGYTHGLVVKSMLEEWKHTGDSTYYDYAKIYADSLIDNDGHIRTMKYLSFNIDNVNAGKILFDFYAQTGDERYKIAMDTLRKQMREQPRTSERRFLSKSCIYLIGGFGIPKEKCHIVPLSCGISKPKELFEKEKFCLHISLLCDERKNVKRLIKASKKYGFRLVLAGKLRNQKEKKLLNTWIDSADNIEYRGYVSHEEKMELYTKAKVFALPWYITPFFLREIHILDTRYCQHYQSRYSITFFLFDYVVSLPIQVEIRIFLML